MKAIKSGALLALVFLLSSCGQQLVEFPLYAGDRAAGACGAPVALGTAGGFAVLAGSGVTSTGATVLTGDLGVSPGTSVIGFPPGTYSGTRSTGSAPAALAAKLDLTTAYNDAAGRSLCRVTVTPTNLGGRTLTPGLYWSESSLEITSGTLTLDAQGDSNAVFVFQAGSTLTTTSGLGIVLAGNAKASNIFWQVGSSATIGTGSAFFGTILAYQSVTMNTGATLNGRALARNGAVTLAGNVITRP
jgi:Ice-binding-like